MRVVAWNCMGGFERKATYLAELAPDLAFVSEVTKTAALKVSDASMIWSGAEGAKGLALFGWNGWTFETVYDSPDRHVLVAKASRGGEGILMVGVWTLPVDRDYVIPIANVLARLESGLSGDVIVAGDFNANPIWDEQNRKKKLTPLVPILDALRDRGIQSIWHERSLEAHGAEKTPTFHMYMHEDKPFHIDYVFASEGLRRRVEDVQIGTYANWVATKRSDHVPIIVDFAPQS